MDVSGTQTIDQPRDRLWDILLDPETLEATIPGAQSLEREDDHYEGTLERGLAGISLTLDATVDITEQERPEWLEVDIEGTDNTTNSRVDGTARVELVEEDSETTLDYTVHFDFSGKLASLGSRIIKRKVTSDLNTFFENLDSYASDTK